LGSRFARELAATVRRVHELPLAWPAVDPPVRRALVNRFPYLLHYAVESDTILIVGVYNAKRRPISWRDRPGSEIICQCGGVGWIDGAD
jgi:hypothetical protein